RLRAHVREVIDDRVDKSLLSSTLRASKKGRPGFVLATASLIQQLRDSFAHDVWNIVRKQMVSRTLDLLPDYVLEHVIQHGQPQVVSPKGNNPFPPACRQPKAESPFLSRVYQIVVELFVDAADNAS
ncbi:MAG: hypothetical protein ACREQ2_08775, partial [Candidatus Binatia bacterium]